MKAVKLLILCQGMIKTLSECDIRMSDWQWVELWKEYERMMDDGVKVTGAVAVLAEKYGVSEASVWRMLRRLGRDVTF